MLSQAHRRSIHTSPEPILGEEETDALMSELPASDADSPVSTATFETAMTALDHRIELGFATLETQVERSIADAFRTMMVILATSLVGGMALSAAIGAGIAQTVGGG